MSTKQKITREILESYLRCKTEATLKLRGESGTKSEYEIWSAIQTTRQRSAATINLIKRHEGRTAEKNVVLTESIWESSPDIILNGCFKDELLSVYIDALVKDGDHSSKRSRPTYIPVLFHDGEVRAIQKALLGLFAVLASELQESDPVVGLIFPSNGKLKVVHLESGLEFARNTLCKVKELHQAPASPMLVLNRHCQVCEFQNQCYAEAVKEDNLSLLQEMKERQIIGLNQK